MPNLKHLAQLAVLAVAVATHAIAAPPPAPATIATIDLSKPFAARSAWRFTAVQAAAIPDPFGDGAADTDTVPGPIQICLRKSASGPCDAQLLRALDSASGFFAEVHFLETAEVVHDAAGRPLLLVQIGSLHSGDGDQLVRTQALAYRASADQFVRVYDHQTGTNNNEEVRFIGAGVLKGDFISAEPTGNAPFGFWIAVNAPSATGAYRQVLRYRSATHYNDGNPLAAIDSEMPSIEQRLGLWRPGSPLPLPPGRACAKPHLVRTELWCS